MFKFFEKLIKPFPPEDPVRPPEGLYAFCRHYTKGVEPHLVVMSILTGLIAVMEVSLFAFLGNLVDWLAVSDRSTFMETEGGKLLWWGLMVVIALPLCVLLHSLIVHQSLLGNYPMAIRWQAHRYLLGQSLAFFQNDFAGRIATKLMQSSLAVRETVMKMLDVLLYIAVYFSGIVVVIAGSDVRLIAPLIFWICCYIGIMYFFNSKAESHRHQASRHAF